MIGGPHERELAILPAHGFPMRLAAGMNDFAASELAVKERFPIKFYSLARTKLSIFNRF